MVKPATKILRIFFVILFILSYIHLWKDYENNIKNFAEPIKNSILKYKNKYGRYPTKIDESLSLLKSSGCNVKHGKIKSEYEGEHRMVFVCKSIFKNTTIHALITPAKPYHLDFYKGYTRCHVGFDTGKNSSVYCYQDPIIDLGIRG